MRTPQTIRCDNIEDFFRAIAELAERGLGFDADYTMMTIKLNGAF